MNKVNKKFLILIIGALFILILGVKNNAKEFKSESQKSENYLISNENIRNQTNPSDFQAQAISAVEKINLNDIEIASNDNSTKKETFKVIKVIDGDTFSILKDGENVFVRLIGIDTPETVHPKKPVECFGKQASEFTKSILNEKTITLEFDQSQGTYDKYGRLLAYAYLPDGTFLNQTLIENGYAYEYTYDLPYPYQAEFKKAESLAKENKIGLWGNECQNEITEQSIEKIKIDNPIILDSNFECNVNKYNCTDFKTKKEAEKVFFSCGGPETDIHKLDSDGDGLICESLP